MTLEFLLFLGGNYRKTFSVLGTNYSRTFSVLGTNYRKTAEEFF